ncbi:hypothetical protein PAAG_12275 [Paracoccidioides lutzii Pb01]|uniref:Uncharacterized protein n=1 Tax=Paracoccidioides lutzii (strain ATCC MYA-826 / Pb01) TaxID=502779 RepID=A0A0A2VJE3_PARBA|nr:hypothetical protein PAAG_12275 [Paracoccidioides lutzii Pb01]KGQ01024.1 hypothetical protein PAAG_12275 [Paracoccidioides lutzii Pb01]
MVSVGEVVVVVVAAYLHGLRRAGWVRRGRKPGNEEGGAELGPLRAAKTWHFYAKTLISQLSICRLRERKAQTTVTSEGMHDAFRGLFTVYRSISKFYCSEMIILNGTS